MSELERELEHARRMATQKHTRECRRQGELVPRGQGNTGRYWGAMEELVPDCPGCVTDADRALWQQIADEITAHLTRHSEDTLL